MCKPVTCGICKNATWWGCGRHVPAVMDPVPETQWCTCEPKFEGDKRLYPPMGAQS